MYGVLDRCRWAHGVAHHIAAGTHGAKTAVADIGNDFFQAAFKHAVELNSLAVGQTHVAKGLLAKVVMDEPLLGCDTAAGHLAADHETPGFVELGLGAFGADIAVILLVGAVVFEQDVGVLRDVRGAGISELLGQMATEAG